MKVLIVGSGGREHAIAWAVSQSAKADKISVHREIAGIRRICRVREHRCNGI